MKYYISIAITLLSSSAMASSLVAKCQNFGGEEHHHISGASKPFTLNDGTTYEFSFSSEGEGSLKYVIDGTGVIEPKREDRWMELMLLEASSSYISGASFEGNEHIQFSLYPSLESAQIIWVTQPTQKKPEPTTLLLKANCEFLNE